jgi:hypothetical protein
MLMSSKPNGIPRAAVAALTITRPVDSTKAAVHKSPQQAPARTETAVVNRVVTKPAVDLAKTIKDTATQQPASSVTAPAQAKAEVAVKTPAVTNAAVQPTHENSAAEQAAALKLMEDKARTEREEADRIKAANDQTPSAINVAEQTTRENDAAEKAAALKAVEDKAAEESATTDRAKAGEQAFFLAQEAGRQAKAVRDAADRAKAEKEADERARTARQNANRVFSNSLFGVGR